MKLFKRWKENRKKRKELIDKSSEMLTYIANFFTKDYIELCSKIIKNYSNIEGIDLLHQIGEFIFSEKFLFFIEARFEMKLVDIQLDVFNNIIYRISRNSDSVDDIVLYPKFNSEAEQLIEELKDAINSFNEKNEFKFFEVFIEKHSAYDNGIYLIANLSNLEKYFKECQ